MSDKRVYTVDELLAVLDMSRSTFERLKRAGKLPFLEELRPRLGGRARYRRDLVDRYLAGKWGAGRSFGRRGAA